MTFCNQGKKVKEMEKVAMIFLNFWYEELTIIYIQAIALIFVVITF